MSKEVKENLTTVYTDLPPATLIEHAIRNNEGTLASNGALRVLTGERTGRSPMDRFIVEESSTANEIDWGKVNKPFSSEKFDALWRRVKEFLASKNQYVAYVHVGADMSNYLPVRMTTATAWQNLFGKNLFILPEAVSYTHLTLPTKA